jgi:tellurite resistance-related uncharacterized protein
VATTPPARFCGTPDGELPKLRPSVVHRFEEFTDDMMVWVFFYGPEGGEAET